MKQGIAVVAVWVMLLGGAALSAQDGAKALEKAMLVERDEHDPMAAVKLYEAIAKDEGVAADVRTRAWLQLGLCLRRLGKIEEAKAALEKSAAGTGDAAQRAKDELAGKGDDKLAQRVRELYEALPALYAKQPSTAIDELRWLGPEAVPHLINRAFECDPPERDKAVPAVNALLWLGGKEVEAFLERAVRSESAALRRVVAAGIPWDIAPTRAPAQPVTDRLLPLCDDGDYTVRSTAVPRLLSLLPRDKVLALVADRSQEVRNAVLQYVRSQINDWGRTGMPKALELWTGTVQRLLAGPAVQEPSSVSIQPEASSVGMAWLATAEGQFLFLRAAELGCWLISNWSGQPPPDAARPDPAAVVRAARALGPGRGPFDADGRRQSLQRFLDLYCWRAWTADDVPAALDLQDLGYQIDAEWLKQHARPADLPRIAAGIAKQPYTDPAFAAGWLVERGQAEGCFAALKPAIAAALEERLGESGRLRALCGALAQIRTPEAAKLMLEVVVKQPKLWGVAHAQLALWEEAAALPLALALLGLPTGYPDQRAQLFVRCADARITGGADRFAKAYELGLTTLQSSQPGVPQLYGCLRRLFPRQDDPPERPQYSDAELAAIVDACLRVDNVTVWNDVTVIDRVDRLPAAVVEVMVRHLPAAARHGPDLQQRATGVLLARAAAQPAVRELTARLLRGSDVERRWVASHLDFAALPDGAAMIESLLADRDSGVVRDAIKRVFAAKDKTLAPAVRRLLAHADAAIRRDAIEVLEAIEGAAALEVVLPLLEDPDSGVRDQVVSMCGRFLEARAAPHLVKALRDENEQVRKGAQVVLEAIRFREDQDSHWQRWLANQGARSAAEALMKQAGRDKPSKVRAAAVRSLGALGDKEALPFLVSLLEDPDAEVVRAAEAAIARLTEGAKDGK